MPRWSVQIPARDTLPEGFRTFPQLSQLQLVGANLCVCRPLDAKGEWIRGVGGGNR